MKQPMFWYEVECMMFDGAGHFMQEPAVYNTCAYTAADAVTQIEVELRQHPKGCKVRQVKPSDAPPSIRRRADSTGGPG